MSLTERGAVPGRPGFSLSGGSTRIYLGAMLQRCKEAIT